MAKRATKVIHINRHLIKQNATLMKSNPNCTLVDLAFPLTAKKKSSRPDGNFYSNTIAIVDEKGRTVARVVYSPFKPLKCGATAYVETDLTVVDETPRWTVKHRIT
jgi:hypothetical protein